MADTAARARIAVLAKAPVAGFAKTRLVPRLGAEGAARLQAALTERAVRTACEAGLGPVTLWCAPDPGHPSFAGLAGLAGLALAAQRGADLGARMAQVVAAQAGPGGVLVIGTDCPVLTAQHLRLSASALAAGDDAVLLPAEDGGYVLIGLRVPRPEVFEGVAWGSERVLAETRVRLRALGLRWSEPATLWDVDRPEDLDRLAREVPELANFLDKMVEKTVAWNRFFERG
jgi:hypothetical protein